MTTKDRTTVSTVAYGIALPQRQAEVAEDSAFRILVIGNLGSSTSYHEPLFIDRDELNDVIRQLHVRTSLQRNPGDPVLGVSFEEFEDFHPDRLFHRLDIFDSLRLRRHRLLNPATCQQEIDSIVHSGQPKEIKSPPASGDLLSEVLRVTQAGQVPLEEQVLTGNVDWDAYVRQLVAPYVVSKADPRQAELLAGVDSAIQDTMRSILHSRSFQQIEAAWRGIHFLTRRLETDRSLQLSVMHVSHCDLQADMFTSDDLTQTRLYKLLVEDVSAEGTDPWSLVVGDYQFGTSADDCNTLARIAKICEAAGTVFVSGGLPEISGCDSPAQNSDRSMLLDVRQWAPVAEENRMWWSSLRSLAAAQHVVLALPRLMARRPYGRDADPIESFQFEELTDGTRIDQYLWMNAAFGVTVLMGQAFANAGHDFADNIPAALERIPQNVFHHAGDEMIQPGIEVAFPEKAADRFAESGLTVLRTVPLEELVFLNTIRTLSVAAPMLP